MKIFSKISNYIHYYFDTLKYHPILVKIEKFIYNSNTNQIEVIYRIGRQKLYNRKDIFEFESEYFGKVPNYDQHRLTKFSIIAHILQDLFKYENCSKNQFVQYLIKDMENEQLF